MTREEAIRKLKRELEAIEGDLLFKEFAEALDMAIEALSSADAIQVTRCKDCKWYLQKQKNLPYNVTKRYCNRTCTLATKEDDYCSYGERRLSSE